MLEPSPDSLDRGRVGLRGNLTQWLSRGGGALAITAGAKAALRRLKPRPVVLVHGVLQAAEYMREVADWIEEEIPGTYTLAVEIGNGPVDSLTRSMNWQTDELARVLQADPLLQDGFNLIGYSQGALLSRGFIERHNRPRVFNFISWLGPQGGQFGVPDNEAILRQINWVTSPMWYSDQLQERLSFGNYWRDPFRLALYGKSSSYLADLNNEREPRNATYRAHLSSLESMLLVYSSADTIIIPKESAWFAVFAPNSTTELVPLEDQALYREDWIGLRTLAESNRLHFGVTNCKHFEATTSACKFQLFTKLSRHFLLPHPTHVHRLVSLLAPRKRRGNSPDGGGGRGGWRGPPAHYDAKAVEREELELLRRQCVGLSNQLGGLRRETNTERRETAAREAALRKQLEAANAKLRLAGVDGGPPPARKPAADQAPRKPAPRVEKAAQTAADDAEQNRQMRRELDAVTANVAAMAKSSPTPTAGSESGAVQTHHSSVIGPPPVQQPPRRVWFPFWRKRKPSESRTMVLPSEPANGARRPND